MAQKKKAKSKTLSKKDLKKTKGGFISTLSAAPANDPSNRITAVEFLK
jgi:hypothetical protein